MLGTGIITGSLRNKLLLTFLFVTLVPVFIATFWGFQKTSTLMNQQLEDELSGFAARTAQSLDMTLNDRVSNVITWSSMEALRNTVSFGGGHEVANALLQSVAKSYDFDLTTGSVPFNTLMQHTNGVLYGMTLSGGSGTVPPCTVDFCGVVYSLNIGTGNFVTFVGPPTAPVGGSVEILGQGFTGTKKVLFNGVSATFTVVSDTYITTTVPTGAKTGYVSVKTPGGTLKSNKKFVVTP